MSKAAEAFRTISEVAAELEIPKHVLRFWEAKFPQIRPMKRGGGRRYYRPEDMELLRGIRHLLHAQGYTIKGVQKILREQGIDLVKQHGRVDVKRTPAEDSRRRSGRGRKAVAASTAPTSAAPKAATSTNAAQARAGAAEIAAAIAELEACRALLMGAPESAAQPARASRRARSARG